MDTQKSFYERYKPFLGFLVACGILEIVTRVWP